jgi:hypothetical protein
MFTAFAGHRLIAAGPEAEVAAAASVAVAAGADRVVIVEDATGRQVELDLRTPKPALAGTSARITPQDAAEIPAQPGRGRPKLGVVAREITLLPRIFTREVKNKSGTCIYSSITRGRSVSAAPGPASITQTRPSGR